MTLRDEDGKEMGKIPLLRSADASVMTRIWSNHSVPGKEAIDKELGKVQKTVQKRKREEAADDEVKKQQKALKMAELEKEMLKRAGSSDAPVSRNSSAGSSSGATTQSQSMVQKIAKAMLPK